MSDIDLSQPEERTVRLGSIDGPIEGVIRVAPGSRTLDELNIGSGNFLTLHAAAGWSAGDEPVAINKNGVLFAVIRGEGRGRGRDVMPGRFTRAALRLRLSGGFEVQGFVHVARDASPLARLSQEGSRFIALTSASVVGPEWQTATPFLAVNREHVLAAQQLPSPDPLPTEATESEPVSVSD